MQKLRNAAAEKHERIILLLSLETPLTDFVEFFNILLSRSEEYFRASRFDVKFHIEAHNAVLKGQFQDWEMGGMPG
jgi:hypothetical protein